MTSNWRTPPTMYTFWSWFLLWERFVLGLGDFQANSNGLWQNPTFSMNKSLLVLADSYNMFGMNDTFDANDLWMIHLIQMICYNDGHIQTVQVCGTTACVLLVWTKALKHWNMIWMIHYIWMISLIMNNTFDMNDMWMTWRVIQLKLQDQMICGMI